MRSTIHPLYRSNLNKCLFVREASEILFSECNMFESFRNRWSCLPSFNPILASCLAWPATADPWFFVNIKLEFLLYQTYEKLKVTNIEQGPERPLSYTLHTEKHEHVPCQLLSRWKCINLLESTKPIPLANQECNRADYISLNIFLSADDTCASLINSTV